MSYTICTIIKTYCMCIIYFLCFPRSIAWKWKTTGPIRICEWENIMNSMQHGLRFNHQMTAFFSPGTQKLNKNNKKGHTGMFREIFYLLFLLKNCLINKYILLDVLVCSIAASYFYKLRCILTSL